MLKNNFFMVMMFGIIALLGTSFEVRSSEKDSLVPYVVGGTVLVGVGVLAVTKTKTFETYSEDRARRAEQKEKAENAYSYARKYCEETGLVFSSEESSSEKSNSEMPVISENAQAFLNDYENQRRAVAQSFVTQKPKETLPSHIIDGYAGERRK
jgi:hypothetical protein